MLVLCDGVAVTAKSWVRSSYGRKALQRVPVLEHTATRQGKGLQIPDQSTESVAKKQAKVPRVLADGKGEQ